MAPTAEIDVEVVYALPDEQIVMRLKITSGATVLQAIAQSGLLLRYPQISIATARAGIFGKIVALDAPLRTGDRVEIYRPLTVDPKEARRRRVKLRISKKSDT